MPVNINLLPDEAIARGITPPDVGNFGTALAATQGYFQKQAEQNLFSGGLPKTPSGDVDWQQVGEQLARLQGAGAIPALAGLRTADIQQRALTSAERGGPGGIYSPMPGQTSERPVLPPSPQRGGTLPTAPLAEGSGGVPAPPGQNLVQSNEVPGSAWMSVDGGPEIPIQATPTSFTSRFTGEAGQSPEVQPTQVAELQPKRVPTQQIRQQPPPPPAQSPLPPDDPRFFTLENAKAYEQRAQRGNWMVGVFGAGQLPAAMAGPKQQAEQDAATSKLILDTIAKRQEQTPDIKAYNLGKLPGETLPQYQARVAGGTEQAKKIGEQFAAQSASIREAGDKAEISIPQLQVVQRSTLDPNFYSGFKANQVLIAKQFIGALGGNPNTAAPMQVAESLLSGSILSGLKAVVQGTGQVRSAELGLMRSQAAALTDSPDAFRTKVEVALRVQQRARDLADLAQNYKNGNLDAGFAQEVKRLPALFSENEIKNPKLLAYPRFNSPQDAAAANLPPGTKFRDNKDNFRLVP